MDDFERIRKQIREEAVRSQNLIADYIRAYAADPKSKRVKDLEQEIVQAGGKITPNPKGGLPRVSMPL